MFIKFLLCGGGAQALYRSLILPLTLNFFSFNNNSTVNI